MITDAGKVVDSMTAELGVQLGTFKGNHDEFADDVRSRMREFAEREAQVCISASSLVANFLANDLPLANQGTCNKLRSYQYSPVPTSSLCAGNHINSSFNRFLGSFIRPIRQKYQGRVVGSSHSPR